MTGLLSILLESYCNPFFARQPTTRKKTFNSPRVLLQRQGTRHGRGGDENFQFSQSLIATQSLTPTRRGRSRLSILLESYCNMVLLVFVCLFFLFFQFSQSLIATFLFSCFLFFLFCFQFSQSLIATRSSRSRFIWRKRTFNSPRVLLQLATTGPVQMLS